MSKRNTILLLGDMRQAALKIKRYTDNLNYNSLISDEKTIDAAIRNFEIIGEAANSISPEFRTQNPEIEWKKNKRFSKSDCSRLFWIWTIIENYLDDLIN